MRRNFGTTEKKKVGTREVAVPRTGMEKILRRKKDFDTMEKEKSHVGKIWGFQGRGSG